jgi:hypothetical protein
MGGSIMASTINASTASGGGIIQTADASGVLQLQTAGTTAISVDASQNVAVTSALNIGASSGGSINLYDQGGTAYSAYTYNSATTTGGAIIRLNRARGTIASPSQILANDTIGGLRGFGYTSAGAFSAGGARIELCAAENFTSTNQGTLINFGTTAIGSTGASVTTQMTIGPDGTITGTKGNLQLISGTAVASTSGTSITFTGIPSWVKRITVMFNGVSTSGTSDLLLRIGSGSVSSSGYAGYIQSYWSGASQGGTNSTGAMFTSAGTTYAASVFNGTFTLCLVNPSTNLWSMTGTFTNNGGAANIGSISTFTNTLAGALDRVSITATNGTDTFDAGSINIMYE